MIRLLFCLLVLLAFPVRAELTFEQLLVLTRSQQISAGNFKQEKYLVEFGVSLFSTGNYEYKKGESIYWKTLEPIENELIMSPTSIISRQQNDELVHLDAEKNPIVEIFNKFLFSIFSADWAELVNSFTLTGNTNGEEWSATLYPTETTIKKIITSVSLSGDKQLKEVIINEKKGDVTTINFQTP